MTILLIIAGVYLAVLLVLYVLLRRVFLDRQSAVIVALMWPVVVALEIYFRITGQIIGG